MTGSLGPTGNNGPDDTGGRDDLTPAERAGATPLDADRFKANADRAKPRPRAQPDSAIDDEALAGQIRVRRKRRRSSRGWFAAAALLGVAGLVTGGVGWFSEASVDVATGTEPRSALTTPVISARRVPEWMVRPVAARNLNAALAPVLASAPKDACVQYSDHGTPVAAHNSVEPLMPASNMKLLTSTAAVNVLGAGTRLSTRFATDGKPTDGATVKGNLYMIGGGDPLLTTDRYAASRSHGVQPQTDLEAVADQIVDTGVRRITGSVVGDESRYDSERRADSWPDRYFTQGQVAPLSALVVDDGWKVGGGPVADPPLAAASVMSDLLAQRGVVIGGDPTTGVAPKAVTTLVDVPSLTIAELVAESLRFSDNTTSEMLVKEVGFAKGAGGSTPAGIDVISDWIAAESLPATGVSFVDGSGLSENDRLTCDFLSSLLASQGPTGPIADGLAVPGQPGTLQTRFLAEPLRSRIRAKTGTLRGATSLSGWLKTDADADLSFSIIINTGDRNVNGSDMSLQTRLLEAALGYPQAPTMETLSPLPPG